MHLKLDNKEWLFSSDLHINHGGQDKKSGIMKHCAATRPGVDVFEMNDIMISRITSKCKGRDKTNLVLAGDIYFGPDEHAISYIQQLYNVATLHLVNGNHDENLLKSNIVALFDTTSDILRITGKRNKRAIDVTVCHYPMISWQNSYHGSLMLHGHTHGTLQTVTKNSMDIGVDTNNLYPYSLDEILTIFPKETKVQ